MGNYFQSDCAAERFNDRSHESNNLSAAAASAWSPESSKGGNWAPPSAGQPGFLDFSHGDIYGSSSSGFPGDFSNGSMPHGYADSYAAGTGQRNGESSVGSLFKEMGRFDKNLAADFGNQADGGKQALSGAIGAEQAMLQDPNLSRDAGMDRQILQGDNMMAHALANVKGGEQMMGQIMQSEQRALASLYGGATTGDTSPVVTTGDTSPVVTTADTSPAATTGDTSPAATTGDTSPAATTGDTSPAATTGDTSPAATTGDTSPAATAGTPPAATAGDTSPAAATGTTAPVAGGNGFSITNGKLEYNGKLLNGIAVSGQLAQEVDPQKLADTIAKQFPGINVIRLATSPAGGAYTSDQGSTGPYETVQNIDAVIKAMNAKGIGVIVDNHQADANNQNNVAGDGSEAAWFSQIAKDNLGSNGVMFQPQNEPTGSASAIVAEQQSAYNAIRATGSNAVVAFELQGGWQATPMQSDPGAYNADSNYVIDAHGYTGNNMSNQLNSTSFLHEANGGKVPVYIGETGNAVSNNGADPGWQNFLNSEWTDGSGAIAYMYDGGTPWGGNNGNDLENMLTGPSTNLQLNSTYGAWIAQRIAEGAS